MTADTNGGAFIRQGDMGWISIFRSGLIIQINERANAPIIEKLISRIIVISGVEAEVLDFEIRVQRLELRQGDKPRNTIMAVCAYKPPIEGQINVKLFVVIGNRIQSVSIIPVFEITVPTMVCFGVGKFSITFAVINSIFTAVTDLDPEGRGMAVNAGSIAGDS